ncbi:MAG TPA: ribosome silencing factor [Terriglobia bacterium]|nr:ribosome silencing factor [Terriglobia bacterium]
MNPEIHTALRAALDHKSLDMNILDLRDVSSFTDYFLICSGTSTRHTQAICDAVLEKLKKSGMSPAHVEGYRQAEWILVDYLNFVVHIFLERSRQFYDLERLWKNARKIPVPREDAEGDWKA